jgi:hypothetical protein
MHPLTGTWTANLAKSQRHVNHQFQGVTMRVEVEGAAVSLRYEGVNATGRSEVGTTRFEADGRAHPDTAAPDVWATSTLSARRLEVIATKDGSPVGRASYEVSADGATLTATTAGIDASGRQFDQVIVFDRATVPTGPSATGRGC